MLVVNTASRNIMEKNSIEGSDYEQGKDAGSSSKAQKVTTYMHTLKCCIAAGCSSSSAEGYSLHGYHDDKNLRKKRVRTLNLCT